MSSFTKKIIETRFTLGAGSFGGQGNQKIVKLLASEATIEKPGLPDKNKANVSIGNVTYDDVAELTTLGFRPGETRKNLIEIYAGDETSALSRVFAGEVVIAFGDFNAAPDPTLEVEAMSGYFPDVTASPPTSFQGEIPVADIISDIAARIGYSFENQGVTARLRNPVLNGSPFQQASSAARQAGATLLADDGAFILLPADAARQGNAVLLRDDTGLIGYPTFTNDGVVLEALFNPAFEYGGLIKVESIVPKASGVWRITKLSHALSANDAAGGAWSSSIEASYISEG